MNTPTHLLVAAAVYARPSTVPGARPVTTAALLGGLLPDLSLYVMVFWERVVRGLSFPEIFDERYFSAFWQGVFAVDNSLPLYALLVVAGAVGGVPWLAALSGAALLHIALDLPLHHDDGRAHFWPFSDWIYESPLSYWDTAQYAWIVAPLEILLALGLSILLWRRFGGFWARAVLAVSIVALLCVGFVWAFLFTG